GIETLACQVKRTREDRVFGKTEHFAGTFYFRKPNQAFQELRQQEDPAQLEKFVCDGKSVYLYYPDNKIVRAFELPLPGFVQRGVDTHWSFFIGCELAEAKRRY